MESIYDCFKLNNDMKIPCVGFGTYKAAEGNNVEILKTAIEAGYRYFDTASFYQTEEFVGQAIRESNLPREDFFLVSKMWKDEMGYQQTKDALEKSLKRLGTDYLDIYLIHWPRPSADWILRPGGRWKNFRKKGRSGDLDSATSFRTILRTFWRMEL